MTYTCQSKNTAASNRIDALKSLINAHSFTMPRIPSLAPMIQELIFYQRKTIQDLIKMFRLRKYNRTDNIEEYRILSVGFQMTHLKG